MASSVYTVAIWQNPSTNTPPIAVGPSPPAGNIWVVRDIALFSPAGFGQLFRLGPGVVQISGIPIAGTPARGTYGLTSYRWDDVRQVVGTTGQLSFTADTPGWRISISGYQLTLP